MFWKDEILNILNMSSKSRGGSTKVPHFGGIYRDPRWMANLPTQVLVELVIYTEWRNEEWKLSLIVWIEFRSWSQVNWGIYYQSICNNCQKRANDRRREWNGWVSLSCVKVSLPVFTSIGWVVAICHAWYEHFGIVILRNFRGTALIQTFYFMKI